MKPPRANIQNLIIQGIKALGLSLTETQLGQLYQYLAELKRWNARINLTALKSDRDIIIKLFLDSLALLPFLGGPSVADLGSGAGFPGLVVKIARPEIALTLVESRGKKAAFLDYLASLLKLDKVEVATVHLTPGLARQWGPRFDAVASRAAFSLTQLAELAGPILQPGGVLLAPKGPALARQEADAAQKTAQAQGLRPWEIHTYRVPFWQEPRVLAVAYKLQSE
ncbi:MAG: 16S rRNA (guanine(527)-N(7))-methyltransferase RsmG [Deltaproteobacteria bacterium]|nr:16S rRNA (guanine(527)-N(7))-methyltransferase RsmG [Deltaproteobacteria bacterium]